MATIAFDEAIERTLRGASCLGSERIALEEATGRVLAEDLVAATPLPAFSHSAMDGYAVKSSHFREPGPWTLRVRGESRAGGVGPPIEQGVAGRIFTGAALPAGADAVIVQEQVSRSGDRLHVPERPLAGQNVRTRGSDLPEGAVALATGTRLTPGMIGLCAALDRYHVLVGRRPVVALLGTGDELREPGQPGPAGSIPESNSYVLAAIARRAGAFVRRHPSVVDEPAATEQALSQALRGADLVVTIGGASVGDHDLVRPALAALGGQIEFWGVAIKPGKPVGLGSHQGTRILCLPGNPASATLTFLLFGVPLLLALQGHRQPRPRLAPLRIVGSHERSPGREEYLRARLEPHDGELCAVLPASQSSGAPKSFADADAVVVLARERAGIAHGDRLPVLLLSELWG